MTVHEEKLRRFGPFSNADERFVAALTTKLRPEVYMPEAYILVAGQVYSCAYFCARGCAQVTWPSNIRDTVNVLTVDDYFGELALFVNKKLAYTVRAITHLDTFRLDRDEFMVVMRSHPSGAVHVADLMDNVLPPKLAKQVTKEIYDYSGLRELLSALQPGGKWRPPKGLADKLRKLAVEHEAALARIRASQAEAGVGAKQRSGADGSARSASPTVARGGGGEDSKALRRELGQLATGQARLEKQMEQLASLLKQQQVPALAI